MQSWLLMGSFWTLCLFTFGWAKSGAHSPGPAAPAEGCELSFFLQQLLLLLGWDVRGGMGLLKFKNNEFII